MLLCYFKVSLTTVGIEPATFGILFQCSAKLKVLDLVPKHLTHSNRLGLVAQLGEPFAQALFGGF